MKKRMILVALLAMPLGSLVARCHTCEEPTVRSSCNMCNLGCNSCKTRSYDRDTEVVLEEYDSMETNPEIMYNTPIEELLEVPQNAQEMLEDQKSGYSTTPMYKQQVVEEQMGEEVTNPMYEQQVVEESVEGTATVTGLTEAQRAQHTALMNELKTTGAKKPSQIAGAKKTTAKKPVTAKTTAQKKAVTTKKTTAAKKPATTKTTPAKKTTVNGKKATTNKTVAQKKRNYAKNTKNKVTKTSNKVA